MDKTEYTLKRLLHMAKRHAESKPCPRCHAKKGNWKVVPLYEFGDPTMPSQVVLYCQACKKYNETFAQAPDEQARAYAEEVMRLKRAGIKKATQAEADALIKKK